MNSKAWGTGDHGGCARPRDFRNQGNLDSGDDGRTAQISEEFALGRVRQPLLCAGKFLRRGWNIKQEQSCLCLSNEEEATRIPLELKRESIQLKAKIMMVSTNQVDQEEVQRKENFEAHMRADKRRRMNRGEDVSESMDESTWVLWKATSLI